MLGWEKPHAQTVAWFHDMLKKCVERCCELANKKVEQHYKVSNPCLDGHQFKQEELESVGELSKFPHKLCKKACIWHELDDLTFCGRSTILQDQSQN